MPNYAILLATMTGMRVGEIAALRWESITDNYIMIDFSEHRLDYADKTEIIIGEPKNFKHRRFPITRNIRELLYKIKTVQALNGVDSEFVFADKTKRYKASEITLAMTRRCKSAKIPKKSIHDIRRTGSSKLRAKLPSATVAALLGHLETTNDIYYNFDVTPVDKTIDILTGLWETKTA